MVQAAPAACQPELAAFESDLRVLARMKASAQRLGQPHLLKTIERAEIRLRRTLRAAPETLGKRVHDLRVAHLEEARRRVAFQKRVAEETQAAETKRRKRFRDAQVALDAHLRTQALVRMLKEPKGFNPADVGAGLAGGGTKKHAGKRLELLVRVVH
eukprot:4867575-Alexandrium_andersonii.AAC.1